jgi:hypothetical protein
MLSVFIAVLQAVQCKREYPHEDVNGRINEKQLHLSANALLEGLEPRIWTGGDATQGSMVTES